MLAAFQFSAGVLHVLFSIFLPPLYLRLLYIFLTRPQYRMSRNRFIPNPYAESEAEGEQVEPPALVVPAVHRRLRAEPASLVPAVHRSPRMQPASHVPAVYRSSHAQPDLNAEEVRATLSRYPFASPAGHLVPTEETPLADTSNEVMLVPVPQDLEGRTNADPITQPDRNHPWHRDQPTLPWPSVSLREGPPDMLVPVDIGGRHYVLPMHLDYDFLNERGIDSHDFAVAVARGNDWRLGSEIPRMMLELNHRPERINHIPCDGEGVQSSGGIFEVRDVETRSYRQFLSPDGTMSMEDFEEFVRSEGRGMLQGR
ncbi:hypothetical protein QR680_016442 [Steinernema hermaphroditum]|uniref:Uncharacterized protein n=1 Tax=Steinernema hermaphroditum TaxID=289476 RepID=A0AA39LMC5_9BILA|nr:hypothetical protein QR680_016442 [Steinernema hermaphroditum]